MLYNETLHERHMFSLFQITVIKCVIQWNIAWMTHVLTFPNYSPLTQTASTQSDKELTCMLRTTTVLALLNATVTRTQSEAYTELCGRKEGSSLLGIKEWNAVTAGNGGYLSTGGIPNKLQSCLWFLDIGTCLLSFLTLVYFGLVKLI